jgi:hypothetical protein
MLFTNIIKEYFPSFYSCYRLGAFRFIPLYRGFGTAIDLIWFHISLLGGEGVTDQGFAFKRELWVILFGVPLLLYR